MPTNARVLHQQRRLAKRMLTRTIAVELAKANITVNNIGPGAVFTPIDADVEAKPEMEKALMGEIPLNRWGKPGELRAWRFISRPTKQAILPVRHISSTAECCSSPAATESVTEIDTTHHGGGVRMVLSGS